MLPPMIMRLAVLFGIVGLSLGGKPKRRVENGSIPIVGYSPVTEVSDYALLDLDQKMIEELALQSDFIRATNIYEGGGHAMSFARIMLLNPAPNQEILAGTLVSGITERGDPVTGILLENQSWSDTLDRIPIKVLYSPSQQLTCQVGGLFTARLANRDGCFAVSGELNVGGRQFPYTYDIRRDNNNILTMQGLSKNAAVDMLGVVDFQSFLDYYADPDYADKWFVAAASGNTTAFSGRRGNQDFSLRFRAPGRGRANALFLGTVVLHVWMAIVRELDYAVRSCGVPCSESTNKFCADNAIGHLDAAAALYAGSLQGPSHSSEGGVMVYALANLLASQMRTAKWAGNEVRGPAYVNLELFWRMGEMQTALSKQDCTRANREKNEMIKIMKVPLAQGILRNSWVRVFETAATEAVRNTAEARAATYAAALLPLLHACDATAAQTVHEYTRVGGDIDEIGYDELRQVLEKQYSCLGITCAQVGGVWSNRRSSYEAGGEPCDDGSVIKARFTEAPTSMPTEAPITLPVKDVSAVAPTVPKAPVIGGVPPTSQGGAAIDTALTSGATTLSVTFWTTVAFCCVTFFVV